MKKNKPELCKKHRRPILPCTENHYGDGCDCPQDCIVCVRVRENEYNKTIKKCNLVVPINTDCFDAHKFQEAYIYKYKPRKRLKVGDYAVLCLKTGYLIKATGNFVQFYVVK